MKTEIEAAAEECGQEVREGHTHASINHKNIMLLLTSKKNVLTAFQ